MSEPAEDAKPSTAPPPAAGSAHETPAGAAAEPATERPARPAHRPRRTVRLPAVVFGLLLLLIVLAAAWITWPLWNAGLPDWMRTALAPAMEAGRGAGRAPLETRLAAVEAEVRAIRGALAQRPSAGGDAVRQLAERADATEKALAGLRDEMGRIGAIDSRVAAVEAAIKARPESESAGQPAGVDPAALAKLTEDMKRALAALRDQNQALAQRLSALEGRSGAAGETARDSAFVLAAGQLAQAVRDGRAYADALAALRAIAGEDDAAAKAVATLESHAAKGVPTVAALRARFAEAAPRIAAASPGPREGWLDRAVDRLGGLITIRRTGPEAAQGTGPEAAVARAELALDSGDLAGAAAALQGLDGPAAQEAAPWLAAARARIAADGAVAALEARAVRRLGGKTGGTPGG